MPNAGSGCDLSSSPSEGQDVHGSWEDDAATTILLDHEFDALRIDGPSRALPSALMTPWVGRWQSDSTSPRSRASSRSWLGVMLAIPLLFAVAWAMNGATVVPQVTTRLAATSLTATARSGLRAEDGARMEDVSAARDLATKMDAKTSEQVMPTVETGFTIDSVPSGATVHVDGVQLAQVTPARVTDLTAGSHSVRLSAGESFADWTMTFAIANGQIIFLPTIELARAEVRKRKAPARRAAGALTIHSVPWANVEIDGAPHGSTPQYKLPLRAGSHRIVLTNDELGLRKSMTVRIAPGKTAVRSVDLTAP